jgi:hypothetical protein
VGTPFTVNASAQPLSGATIEGMIIWLDGVQYGPIINNQTLSVPVTAAPGGHVIAVSAWDTAGATGFSPTYTITVGTQPTAPSTGSTQTSTSTTTATGSTPTTSSTPASAGTVNFYVSQDGSDSNPGTLAAPWLTIQKAMNSATPGSTVNVRGGTYHERLTLNVSGTAGNYITFQPYGFNVPAGDCGGYTGVSCGGDQVILDYGYLGTVSDGVPFLLVSNKSYLRVQGIVFQNYSNSGAMQQGVRVDGSSSYVEFNYNKFFNNHSVSPWDGSAAFLHIYTWGPANNVRFYGNEIGNIVSNYSEALSATSGASNVTIQNNWIHDTDAIGIDMHDATNNYAVVANKLENISVKRDGTVWYGNPAVAIYNDGGYSGIMARNIVNHAGTGYEALSEPGQPDTHDINISDNIAENCTSAGIVIGTWYSTTSGASIYNVNVFNNTFYANSVGVAILPMTSSTVTWENNIIANNATNYYNSLNWNPGNTGFNLYYGSDVGPGANNQNGDPLFTNAAAGDFSLQSSTPAANAGDPNTPQNLVGPVDFAGRPRVLGGAIDIGAYETR